MTKGFFVYIPGFETSCFVALFPKPLLTRQSTSTFQRVETVKSGMYEAEK